MLHIYFGVRQLSSSCLTSFPISRLFRTTAEGAGCWEWRGLVYSCHKTHHIQNSLSTPNPLFNTLTHPPHDTFLSYFCFLIVTITRTISSMTVPLQEPTCQKKKKGSNYQFLSGLKLCTS